MTKKVMMKSLDLFSLNDLTKYYFSVYDFLILLFHSLFFCFGLRFVARLVYNPTKGKPKRGFLLFKYGK